MSLIRRVFTRRIRRAIVAALGLAATGGALGSPWTIRAASAQGASVAAATPIFEVDTTWPKPLPNGWTVGPVSGITADTRDHVWIIQRAEPVKAAGGQAAPPVIEFDPAGNVVQTWGGPGAGYEWPEQVLGSFGGPGPGAGQFATSLHDIVVDSKGSLYTGEAATGGRVQKFRVKQ